MTEDGKWEPLPDQAADTAEFRNKWGIARNSRASDRDQLEAIRDLDELRDCAKDAVAMLMDHFPEWMPDQWR